GSSSMGRRIWAKKGGGAERPFDDSGTYRAANDVAVHSQPALDPSDSINKTPVEITDVPPDGSPPATPGSQRMSAELRLTPPPIQLPSATTPAEMAAASASDTLQPDEAED